MLTVLIDCGAEANRLGLSLASLVPGAVEGLVRDVVVIDRGMDAGARKVADHAGCRIVPANEFRTAVAGAKGEWLMLLEPGAQLAGGWIEAIAEHLAASDGRAARFTPARGALFDRLEWPWRRRTALAHGLVLPKAQGAALAAHRETLAAMAAGISATRLAATIRAPTAAP